MSTVSNSNQEKIVVMADQYNKEILLLGNDLLFPDGESMAEKIGGKEFFMGLLCEAPCTGPCQKEAGYGKGWPGQNGRWPDFECPNVVGWKGNRWDGEGTDPQEDDSPFKSENSKGNGLDYMALFNMYMLQYGTGDFYNPAALEHSNNLNLQISGPATLCPQQTGDYELVLDSNAIIQNLSWSSSDNIHLFNTVITHTSAEFIASNPVSGSINATYSTTNSITQEYNLSEKYWMVNPQDTANLILVPHGTFEEQCENNWAKQVILDEMNVSITRNIDPCAYIFNVIATVPEGTDPARYTYSWIGTNNNFQITASGPIFDLNDLVFTTGPHGVQEVQLFITLTVTGECGTKTITRPVHIVLCDDGIHRSVRVTPNPTQGDISINLSQTDGQIPAIDPIGYPVSIRNINGGPNLVQSRLYNNGQTLNVSALSNGYYNLSVDTGDIQPLTTIFVILR